MVNFRDPDVVAHDSWVVANLWHTLAGLFIWEFFITLGYEWSVIRGHRRYRWTIWIYSFTRVATLVVTVLAVVSQNVTRPYNCQVVISIQLAFGYSAFAAAELLVVLRIVAAWNNRKVVVWLAVGAWVMNVAFLIQDAVRIRSRWVPAQRTCMVTNIESSKLSIIVTIVTDVVFLLIMIVGLRRQCSGEGGTFTLARLLCKQGVIWLLFVIAIEIPAVVLIMLDLNAPLNRMFHSPLIIVMTIGATRTYRALADFISGTTDITSHSFINNGHPVSKSKRHATQTTLSQIRVAVRIPREGYPETNDHVHHVSTIATDEGQHDKRSEAIANNDLESGIEAQLA